MKKIELTQGEYALVDNKDYEKLKHFHYHVLKRKGRIRAVSRCWYDGKTHTAYLHRDIMRPKKSLVVDHINGNPLDNRRKNLRICRQQNNVHNASLRRDNTSGYKGVRKEPKSNKWLAAISIGSFLTAEEAAKAYNKIAKKLFGKYAYLNKIKRQRKI